MHTENRLSNYFYKLLANSFGVCLNCYMTHDDIIKHYGGQREAMTALAQYGIYRQIMDNWKRDGVPELRQFQLYVITGGKLKIDREYY